MILLAYGAKKIAMDTEEENIIGINKNTGQKQQG